jgi:hypothetical protein
MMFQIAKSVFPPNAENIFTASSGVEVQNATIVKPTTIAGILYFKAIEEAPETKRSAPLIRIKKPIINNK